MALTLGQTIGLLNDADGDGVIDPGESTTVTLTLGTGASGATGASLTINLSGLTYVNGSINVSPLAFDDAFTPFGNTPFTGASLLANDLDLFGDTFGLQTATGVSLATTQGGTIVLNANGTFTYNSALGFTGTDTFTYTVADSHGATGQGVVTFEVGPAVWYIDDTAGGTGGTGTKTDPFRTIADFNAANTGGAGKPEAGDVVYLRFGNDGVYSSADGINLLANQQLIGQGDNLTLTPAGGGAAVTLETGSAGQTPTISVTGAGNHGIDLASGNTIHGLNVATTLGSQVGIDDNGGSVGTLTISNVDVTGVGKAVDIDQGGALSVAIDKLTSTGSTTEGLDLGGGVTGTFNISDVTSAISGSTGTAFNVGSGTASIDYNGTIAKTSDGRAIVVNGHTAGVVSFDGAVSSTSAADGVTLTGNTTATVVFTGGLNIVANSGGGTAFDASGGGFIGVTGATNVIDATGVGGLSVSGTTIGAAGLTFQKISSVNGANNGITLNNTGTTAGLTITGVGSTANSGGVISGKTGADGSATSGSGIYLNNTRAISLSNMDVEGNQNYGVRGIDVVGFSITGSTVGVTAKNGTSVNAEADATTALGGEASLRFNNLSGTASFTNSTFDNGYARTVLIQNGTVGSTLTLNITNSTLRESLNNANGGDPSGGSTDAMTVQGYNNTTFNLNMTGSHVTAYRQFGILTDARDTAKMNIDIGSSDFSNSNTGNVGASTALNFSGSGSSGNDIHVKYNVHDSTFRHGSVATGTPTNGGAQIVSGQVSGGGAFDGTILNNTFGVQGVANSGAGGGADVLRLFASGNQAATTGSTGSTHTRYLVKNNIIQDYGEVGIQINARQGNAVIDATVVGNTIREPGTPAQGAFGAIWVNSGALASDSNVVNITIGGTNAADKNTLTNTDPNNFSDVFLDSQSDNGGPTTINLFRNGSTASGSGEALIRQILVDDNNGPLDLLSGFTNGSTIGVVSGLPPQPSAPLNPDLAPVLGTAGAFIDPNDHTLDYQTAPVTTDAHTVFVSTDEGVVAVDKGLIEQQMLEALASGSSGFTLGTLPSGKTVTITFQATVDQQADQLIVNATYGATITSNQPTVTAGPTAVPLDSLTLGGLIWGDTDRDGVLDAGENGVSGVTVEVYADTDDSGGYSAGDVLVTTVTTGATVAGANYNVAGLAPGDYIVRLTNGRAAFPLSGVGETDPDNNIDGDDNGYQDGGAVVSRTITLAYNTEVTNGVGNDTNTTLDFALGAAAGGGADTLFGESGADIIDGLGGDDVITGGAGADTLTGSGGLDLVDYAPEAGGAGVVVSLANGTAIDTFGATDTLSGFERVRGTGLTDILIGDGAANVLVGGAGDDVMKGGLGDDVYEVTDAGDNVVENAGEGTDSVFASLDFALGANIETLSLQGTAVLGVGNALNNTLYGTGGANTLIGGAGTDLMIGGAGNDTYEVTESGDAVVEAAGGGTDIVVSSVDYALSANVENLTLVGSAVLAVGNGLDNGLFGNANANTLIGGAGGDAMRGMGGDDTYEVDSLLDVVIEGVGQGIDTVYALISGYTLTLEVETLVLAGAATTGSGNSTNNTLIGNALDNTLNGGAGQDYLIGGGGLDTLSGGVGDDTLSGGAGADSFVWTGLTAGQDVVLDFATVEDKVTVSTSMFANFAAVQAKAFQSGADTVIAYDAATLLVLKNVAVGSLTASNFTFDASSPSDHPQVLPAVPDGETGNALAPYGFQPTVNVTAPWFDTQVHTATTFDWVIA